MRIFRSLVILLWTCFLGQYADVSAQQIIEPKVGSELRQTLLDVVRVEAERKLQTQILFMVEELRTDGRWAFLSAIPVTRNLTEIDYAKTKFARQFEEGMFDNFLIALLLKERGQKWRIMEFSLGSTDSPFVDWPERYGVPRQIIIPNVRRD